MKTCGKYGVASSGTRIIHD